MQSCIVDTAIKRPLPECFLPFGRENGDYAVQRRNDDSTFFFVGSSIVLSGHYELLVFVSDEDAHLLVDGHHFLDFFIGEHKWSAFTHTELYKSKWQRLRLWFCAVLPTAHCSLLG